MKTRDELAEEYGLRVAIHSWERMPDHIDGSPRAKPTRPDVFTSAAFRAGYDARDGEVRGLQIRLDDVGPSYQGAVTEVAKLQMEVKKLVDFLSSSIAPSWLPSGIRDERRVLLKAYYFKDKKV